MKLSTLLKKCTQGEFYLGVGTQHCFHSGNRVAVCHACGPVDDPTEETVAEFWPADGDKDRHDAQLYVHMRRTYTQMLDTLKGVVTMVEYYNKHEGCLVTLADLRDTIRNAENVKP